MLKNKYCSPINCLFTHLLLFMQDIFWAYFLLHPGLKEQSDLCRLLCPTSVHHHQQRTIPSYFEYIIEFLNVPLFFLQPKNVLCMSACVCVCVCFVCVCVCVCAAYVLDCIEKVFKNKIQPIRLNLSKETILLQRKFETFWKERKLSNIYVYMHARKKSFFSISIPFSFSMILNIVSSCEGVRKQEMLL